MYEQYLGIKKEHPEALLFYRMGDFYELFFKDAEIVSKELQLTLTSRTKDSKVPMCGMPWHAAQSYISQLIDKGYKVAICDQVEDPKLAKGLVKREVTRIITAATSLDELNLEAKAHTYLGALLWSVNAGAGAFAWLDVSTGSWSGMQSSKEQELWQWVHKISPKELLVPNDTQVPNIIKMDDSCQIAYLTPKAFFDIKRAESLLLSAQKVADLNALGLENKQELTCCCGALIAYLEQTQKVLPSHLWAFEPLDSSSFMMVDEVTERNLEIFRRYDGRKGIGTLWHELDETLTPMGGRLLEERLRYPWKNLNNIHNTQDVVEHFVQIPAKKDAVRSNFKYIADLERLSTRISLNRCLPKDFIALKQSLLSLPELFESLQKTTDFPTAEEARGEYLPKSLRQLLAQWDNLEDLATILEKSISDEPPTQITEGKLFKQGFHKELDTLIDLAEHGENMLQNLLQQEQTKSNLPKLKIGFNRVFGYYFELSKGQQGKIPEHFDRRQSLINAERFITTELKELEEKLLSSSESRNTLEYKLFQSLREHVSHERPRILFMAGLLAQIDVWQSLANTAIKKDWVRPLVDDTSIIHIEEGRHPVIEAVLGKANFVPNTMQLDQNRKLILITGPNMSGKSTILRQSAIICMLAQMGSFVPAKTAHIGLVDRVFSRVGASDNLAQGQSTFMVEMMETARILRQSTKRSFVILDEIGRGTSTFDGLALAWAIVEELIHRAQGGIRTLFATHYHELTVLEGKLKGVCNMNVAIREWNGDIVFLRRLIPGPADKSYGIEVARLAGVPQSVVLRAKEVLTLLEKDREKVQIHEELSLIPIPSRSASKLGNRAGNTNENKASSKAEELEKAEHPVLEELKKLNPANLTPLEALTFITQWHKKI